MGIVNIVYICVKIQINSNNKNYLHIPTLWVLLIWDKLKCEVLSNSFGTTGLSYHILLADCGIFMNNRKFKFSKCYLKLIKLY